MKKLIVAVALALSLPACATTGIPTTPAAVANQSIIDERLATGANLAYKGFRLAVETGVESGLIKGQLAARIALLDNELFEAIQAVDTAYRTANSTSLVEAVGRFNTLLAQGNALIPRKGQ